MLGFLFFFFFEGGELRCFRCRRMHEYTLNAENHNVFNFVTEIVSIFTNFVDYFLSCLADSILNVNKYISTFLLLALVSQAMHHITSLLNDSFRWSTVYKTLDTWARTLHNWSRFEDNNDAMCWSSILPYRRQNGIRIQKVSYLISTMFPSNNWDYVHWKETRRQLYTVISCCRLLSGHIPSQFSFKQVFFSLNASFSVTIAHLWQGILPLWLSIFVLV